MLDEENVRKEMRRAELVELLQLMDKFFNTRPNTQFKREARDRLVDFMIKGPQHDR